MMPWLAVAAALLASPGLSADIGERPGRALTPEQGQKLAVRLSEMKPFLESAEATRERASLGRFFRLRDYRRLRGNPFLGYWETSLFFWTGQAVAFDGIASAGGGADAISASAWQAAFAYVAGKHGLVVDANAKVRVRGACVGAVVDPTVDEPNRGVELELRIDSPTGPLLFRGGLGKPTVEDAVGASLDFVISYALTVNQPQRGGRR